MNRLRLDQMETVRGAARWLPFVFGLMMAAGHMGAQTTGLMPPMSGDCSVSATGSMICTKTNGAGFSTSATVDATNAANLASGTLSSDRLPSAGIGAGSVSAATVTYDDKGRIAAIAGVTHVSYTGACFDDSYGRNGATQYKRGYCPLMKKDTPTVAPWLGDFSTPGFTMPQIAQSVLTNWAPNATTPSSAFVGGGENDSTACPSGGANCVANFSQAAAAGIYWAAVAAQHRTLMSNVTKTGSWSNNTLLAPVNPLTGTVGGSAVQSTSNGASLSFTVPATNRGSFGLYVYVATSTTGTFTVAVDGSAQTSVCSGTATFSSGGCGGAAVAGNGPQRIRIAVTPGVAHNVTITQVGTAANTFVAWDYVDAALPANTNAVIVRNAGAAFDASGWTAAAIASVVAQARADGLNGVVLSDARSALLALPDGGVSMTSTAAYAGSTSVNHPRDGGHLAMEQAALQAQAANHYVVSVEGAGAPEVDADIYYLQQWHDARTATFGMNWLTTYRNLNADNDFQTNGALLYGGSSTSSLGWRIGSGAFPDGGNGGYLAWFGNVNRHCFQRFTTAGTVTETNFTNTYCVNPMNGNATSSGQFQSYASGVAGFHGTLFTPGSSSAACVAGDFADDANFHYVCAAANTWKRVALSAF